MKVLTNVPDVTGKIFFLMLRHQTKKLQFAGLAGKNKGGHSEKINWQGKKKVYKKTWETTT
ncbi:hypothetical protein KKE88_01850 [Patescibacteria group bacterium]|nr:hypothetical protein [Patescibacteria group bacterium]